MPVFLFTDIERSTQLWEQHRAAMARALIHHDDLLQSYISQYGGRVIKHTGDGVFAVFEEGDPLRCVIETQTAFAQTDWSPLSPVRIRIALHAGDAEKRGDDYFGPAVNRTARLLPIGWGGQILLTPSVAQSSPLPEEAVLKDLGAHLLPDLHEPQIVYTLLHPQLAQQEFPPLRTLSVHAHNLPRQSSPFVGRERELAELHRRMKDSGLRLLTLVGPGGMGKTRLAIQLTAEEIAAYRHGVYFVPLAAVSHPDSVIPALASSLNFVFHGPHDPATQLLRHLRDKQMLIVLDNFEHLLEAAPLLLDILDRAPQVRLLVTSRERLNLLPETAYSVPGMGLAVEGAATAAATAAATSAPPTPDADSALFDAIELFLQSARQASPDFTPTEEELTAIHQICRLVEGMPLAIELAAAWTHLLSCQQIAAQIERSFTFLTSAATNVPERQSSLRAVFDYLWGFFANYERRVLCRLAIFRGGFCREAAAEVADASFFFLTSLVDRALLRETPDGRYEMHEMLRQFTLEQMAAMPGEQEYAADRHAAYYAAWLGQREEALRQAEQKTAQAALSEEFENVKSAWHYLLELWRTSVGRPKATAALQQMNLGVYIFYETRSLFMDGYNFFTHAADQLKQIDLEAMTPTEQNLWARLTAYATSLNYQMSSSHVQALESFESCLRIFQRNNSRYGQVLVISQIALAHYQVGNYGECVRLCQNTLELARMEEMPWHETYLLKLLGNVVYMQGRYLEARVFYEDSRAVAEKYGYLRGLAAALNNLGNVASSLGEFTISEQSLEDALTLYKEIGYQTGVANTLNNLAHVATMLGNYDRARHLYYESLLLHQKAGAAKFSAFALKNIGDVALAADDLREANKLYQQSLAIYREIDDRREIAYSYNHLGDVNLAEGDYAAAAVGYQQALAIFRELDYHPGQSYALDSWGRLARLQGDYETAQQLHQESLTRYRENNNDEGVGYALNHLGLVALAEGEYEQGQRLLNDSLAAFEKIGSHRGIVTSLTDLGQLMLEQGERADARDYLRQALRVALNRYALRPALKVLLSLAVLRRHQADHDPIADSSTADQMRLEAVELAELCRHHPASDRETRQQAETALRDLREGVAPDQVAAAQERAIQLTFVQLNEKEMLRLAGCD
jgi:predicted ATPase/class 3 adenylate cyclase/uncharacterized protein HemY